MSAIVQCGETILWEPSTKVALMFCAVVDALAAVTGENSGIQNDLAIDEININAAVFQDFAASCVAYLAATNNGPLFVLSSGCLEVLFCLHEKLFGYWPDVPENLQNLLVSAQTLLRSDWQKQQGCDTTTLSPHITASAENWIVYGPADRN